MSNNVSTISTGIKMAAFGITLAMLPCALLYFLGSTEIIKYLSNTTEKVLIGVQLIGYIIAAIALLGCKGNAAKFGIPSASFVLCAVGFILVAIYQFIIGFCPEVTAKLYYDKSMTEVVTLNLVLNVVKYMPLAIGTLMAGRHLHALRLASVIFFIMVVYPVIDYLCYELLVDTSDYWSTDFGKYRIATSVIGLLTAVICIIAWWRACGNASELEAEYEENGDADDTTVYVEPAAQPAAAPVAPAASAPAQSAQPATAPQPAAPAGAITEDQRRLLMGMSDDELTKVINNPMLYANPAFVEEARTMLLKRQAWEMIKDYSDAQLLDIVHNNTQGFAYEVLDASSMELLARETEEFVNEVKALSTDQLQGIVSNPGSYFDGYVRLATRTLDERLNGTPASQPDNN